MVFYIYEIFQLSRHAPNLSIVDISMSNILGFCYVRCVLHIFRLYIKMSYVKDKVDNCLFIES